MSWGDMFDGATMMAVELSGMALVSLLVVMALLGALLAFFLLARCFQALLCFAVRQIRARGLRSFPRSRFCPATLGACAVRPAFHVSDEE